MQAPGIPAVRAAAERIRAGKTVVFTVERPPYSSGMSGGSTPRSDQRRVVTAPQVQGPATPRKPCQFATIDGGRHGAVETCDAPNRVVYSLMSTTTASDSSSTFPCWYFRIRFSVPGAFPRGFSSIVVRN